MESPNVSLAWPLSDIGESSLVRRSRLIVRVTIEHKLEVI